ncbi:MAG: PD40 domain-containing protein [Anaerolineae bacterium]|nr:PD40 domain-containing protein [Anaerolineae bacterium]
MREIVNSNKRKGLIISGCIAILFFGLCLVFVAYLLLPESAFPIEAEASPSWAPDGRHLVYECYIDKDSNIDIPPYKQSEANICISNLEKQSHRLIITDPGADRYPVWSPDGGLIAYLREEGIYLYNVEEEDKRQLYYSDLKDATLNIDRLSWSPDGNRLLFSGCLGETSIRDLFVVEVNSGELSNLTNTNDRDEISPHWIMDGTRIVFLSSSTVSFPSQFCGGSGQYGPYQIGVLDDGDTKEIIYDGEVTPSPFFDVSNSGQIAYTTDVFTEIRSGNAGFSNVYIMNLEEGIPIEIERGSGPISWSPSGHFLAFNHNLNVFNASTQKIHQSPIDDLLINVSDIVVWSPDDQILAVTALRESTKFFDEDEHIYIIDLQEETSSRLIP